ncbi:fumarylacetoacetate hydrolase family protein [Hymenobacter caeli]|uniref:2-keto-4-pentenoate hydratase/2-oxohepta-3-ene-1,7-dioic acid hydratase in catechol pathway n=1 Tax=Hymenobacter caeli TaxID=2735894 RepID=A0ABX2FMJ3_9BACT|nr:fumarylacetoacetate hydrolase family protein [Hymenobacter caeli]NRT17766.1 2-keto-4-pentenoate hydratase/2-oxohepta-3-ene-1,7-dioic acid hydratase in catechol pathway [Hymenobacter caeli]
MQLFRFGPLGHEQPGVRTAAGQHLDVSAFGEDYNEAFFATDGLARLAAWLAAHEATCPAVPADARLGSCVARPSKIVCIGLNYRDHGAETGLGLPTEPVFFLKATSALCGPHDDVVLPRGAEKLDWEAELAFVIGKQARYVPEADALGHVAGYTILNDYSERAFQLERGGQWTKGKSADTFAPLGPYLTPAAAVPDPENLRIWLTVNGGAKQEASTHDLVFGIAKIISYVSEFMTLLPGDVISTGSPAGTGLGLHPPQYLRAGDAVALGIEGLGEQRQRVAAFPGQ